MGKPTLQACADRESGVGIALTVRFPSKARSRPRGASSASSRVSRLLELQVGRSEELLGHPDSICVYSHSLGEEICDNCHDACSLFLGDHRRFIEFGRTQLRTIHISFSHPHPHPSRINTCGGVTQCQTCVTIYCSSWPRCDVSLVVIYQS